ncbi:MAG: hypothetical protein M0Z85_09270 [Gammaproteobacteria bacterium]|nr:hypothetical protein [Gammaproteobacteria bacterium]
MRRQTSHGRQPLEARHDSTASNPWAARNTDTDGNGLGVDVMPPRTPLSARLTGMDGL